MKRFKTLFNDFIKAEAATAAADIENDEAGWDRAYAAEFSAHAALVNCLCDLCGIDAATARAMIATKREKLQQLADRII